MTQEEFFEEENERNIQRDKVYKAHIKNMEALTKRQVIAAEKLVTNLTKYLTTSTAPTKAKGDN